MTTISPSLLSCDFLNIESELNHFLDFSDIWFHLDVMDGHFVPNTTFGHPIIKLISKKTKVPLDAHLMVTNPSFYIDSMKDLGIHNLTFHLEASENPLELIKEAKKNFKSVGLSIKPGTSASLLTPELLNEVDLVLIMSVEPGFGGQGFIESTYDKLLTLTPLKQKYNFKIQIDGGVNDKNAPKLIKHGVDNLVAGSFIFKGGPSNYQSNISLLRN